MKTTEHASARQVGRRIPRVEDLRLLRGEGRYVSDISLPRTLHAHFVRSHMPHGRIRTIDTAEATALPGVHSIWTFDELKDLGATTLKVIWNHPDQRITETALLAVDRVRWVGQPVAVVLAETPYIAEDAGELVALDIEPLPPVVTSASALTGDAPRLYDSWPDNVLAEFEDGPGADPEVFATAPVVIRERFSMQRMAASPMEGRATLAEFSPGDRLLTAWISTQTAHHAREMISKSTGWPEHELRVITPDVGGGFGLKEPLYAEDVIVCVLARQVRRPVKWVEDRRENLVGSSHCRECEWDLELAADADGRILGLRGELVYDMGGEPTGVGIGPARIAADMLPGPYRITEYGVRVRGVVTNKTPNGPYRGYGGPESAFAIERLMDILAARVGLDVGEVRRRNFVTPDDLPYETPTFHVYDSGDYSAGLDTALAAADFASFAARADEARARGRLRGIGVASFVMTAGLPPSRVLGMSGMEHGNHETVTVRMDATGKATVLTGTSSQGQGHRTVLAQVCADVLALDPERDVRVIQGDSDATPYSSVSAVASRVASVAGAATAAAAAKLGERLVAIAAHKLGAEPDDIELRDGAAHAGGGRVTIREIAHEALMGFDLPDGMIPGLEATASFEPQSGNYPYGTHVAEIEIDPATGALDIVRYVMVNDSGTLLNPLIAEGQLIGGAVQGIGNAVLEAIAYDAGGQIQTASFMDYLLPTADSVPAFEIHHLATPAPDIPGGAKGIGESGTLAPAAAIANALANALGDPGLGNHLPLDPPTVWAAARRSRSRALKEDT